MKKASVIVSFYNKVDWLKLVLAGLEAQNFKDFEVIVADDGSTQEVVAEIGKIKNEYSYPIQHIWHEDKGWQKNTILNKAVVAASSEYLIFIDGDCIPHSRFVFDHFQRANKNTILAGRRVNLPPKLTKALDINEIMDGKLENKLLQLFYHQIVKKYDAHAEKGIRLSSPFLRKLFIKNKFRGLLGCNFSVHKQDLLDINGFDERYALPTLGEDDDIEFRMLKSGKQLKQVRNAAIVYHMHHKLLSRENQENWEIFNDTRENKLYFTPYGIKKLKSSS